MLHSRPTAVALPGALPHILLVVLAALAALACGSGPAQVVQSEPSEPGPQQSQAESAEAEPVDPPATLVEPDLGEWLDLPEDVAPIAFPWTRMMMETGDGALELGVFIADTSARRQRGLMYARGLPAANAMLFVFENPPVRSGFWNNNVPIDLHVAFLDAEGRILEFVTLEARSTEIRAPDERYHYALEMPAGRYAELGIEVGDRLAIDAAAIGAE